MKKFSNWAALEQYLKTNISAVLGAEVLNAVKTEEQRAIVETVYNVYGNYDTDEPNVYVRRYGEAGLADRANIVGVVQNGVLCVTNEAKGKDGDYGNGGAPLAPIIEDGGPYDYEKGRNTYGDFRRPRPFTEATRARLASNREHINVMKDGLNSRGIPTK